jgi:hypothetical protein
MATSLTPTRIAERQRAEAEDDEEAPIGELVERAIAGARDLATHEATLALVEVEQDAQAIRTTVLLALVGASCVAVSIAWAGVAVALAVGAGASGLAIAALVLVALGAAILVLARKHAPTTLLGKSRARLERRIARVTESLR